MNIMSGSATIPLTCNICSKKPDFSDVSHLLTHIASKGHLSSYYRMKVKASADDECQRLVGEYDEWYAEWSLDDLMRERMSQKDKRSGRGGTTVSRRGSAGQSRRATLRPSTRADTARRSAPPASTRSTPAASLNGRRTTRQLRDSVLNPRLNRDYRAAPMSRSGTPLSAASLTGSMHRPYGPAVQSWPTTPYADSPVKRESIGSSVSDDSFGLDAEPTFMPPPRRSTRRKLSDTNDSVINEDLWEMDETTSDAAKLKGVLWPGMAMFDSATPEMKRKRNQKKDYSVVAQLMATSEYVEPNEMIFDVEGNFRKQRVITGNADLEDDDGLLSGEATPDLEPLKKRQTRRPRLRPALIEKNVNTGRVLRRRSSHHPPQRPRKGPYFDGQPSEDDDLTYGPPLPKKRTGLSIHRDNTGPEITFNEPPPQPPPGYFAASFRNPFQTQASHLQHPQPTFTQNSFSRSHQRLPSFTFGDSMFGAPQRSAPTSQHLPSFASFGGLNTHTLFQNSPWQVQNGTSALAAFQQHFGGGQQNPFGSQNNMFQPHAQNHSNNHHHDGWDFLAGLGQPDVGMSNSMDTFQTGTELNPLFFSSNQPIPPEDDDATISPPPSEH